MRDPLGWKRWAEDLNQEQLEAVLDRLAKAVAKSSDAKPAPERRPAMVTVELRGSFTEAQRERLKEFILGQTRLTKRNIEGWGDPQIMPEAVVFTDDFFHDMTNADAARRYKTALKHIAEYSYAQAENEPAQACENMRAVARKALDKQ